MIINSKFLLQDRLKYNDVGFFETPFAWKTIKEDYMVRHKFAAKNFRKTRSLLYFSNISSCMAIIVGSV